MLLYLIIVILSVMIISMGKNVYDNINNDRNTNYQLRVSLSYLANKIRQSDKQETIEIKELQGVNSIVISEIFDEGYKTWIYFYNGSIYEMLTDDENSFELSDGMEIVDLDLFTIEEINDGLYKFVVASNGKSAGLYLSLYSN